MLSVFTPSHDTRWLDQAYRSLHGQTCGDWEWVVLLNKGAYDWEPDRTDERVRVVRAHESLDTIGALKAAACAECSGSILVELDHDDVLLPGALDMIAAAFDEHLDATLVYSDFAHITDTGDAELSEFDASLGWRFTMELVGETVLKRWHSFEPIPPNIGIIWFAPNHVRAFSAGAYREVGGHNPTLRVLDDLDLMHRLYLHGPFVRIPRLLYLHRVHDHNSQRDPDLNAQIQRDTIQLYCQRREALHAAWAARLEATCLH